MFCEYIEVYEIRQMIELFNSFPAKAETIRTWFKNITGCVWVGCFNYENWWGDNKAIIAYKMDDWGEWFENEEGEYTFYEALAKVEEQEKQMFGEDSEE